MPCEERHEHPVAIIVLHLQFPCSDHGDLPPLRQRNPCLVVSVSLRNPQVVEGDKGNSRPVRTPRCRHRSVPGLSASRWPRAATAQKLSVDIFLGRPSDVSTSPAAAILMGVRSRVTDPSDQNVLRAGKALASAAWVGVGAPPLSPDLGLGTGKELRVPSSGAPARGYLAHRLARACLERSQRWTELPSQPSTRRRLGSGTNEPEAGGHVAAMQATVAKNHEIKATRSRACTRKGRTEVGEYLISAQGASRLSCGCCRPSSRPSSPQRPSAWSSSLRTALGSPGRQPHAPGSAFGRVSFSSPSSFLPPLQLCRRRNVASLRRFPRISWPFRPSPPRQKLLMLKIRSTEDWRIHPILTAGGAGTDFCLRSGCDCEVPGFPVPRSISR
jgi:hypothetical protein